MELQIVWKAFMKSKNTGHKVNDSHIPISPHYQYHLPRALYTTRCPDHHAPPHGLFHQSLLNSQIKLCVNFVYRSATIRFCYVALYTP
jgi:hypothetical protein